MTKATKPLTRETESTIRDRGKRRPIVVSLRHGGMVLAFRLKNTRRSYTLPTTWCFVQAVEAYVQAMKQAKREARKRRHRLGAYVIRSADGSPSTVTAYLRRRFLNQTDKWSLSTGITDRTIEERHP